MDYVIQYRCEHVHSNVIISFPTSLWFLGNLWKWGNEGRFYNPPQYWLSFEKGRKAEALRLLSFPFWREFRTPWPSPEIMLCFHSVIIFVGFCLHRTFWSSRSPVRSAVEIYWSGWRYLRGEKQEYNACYDAVSGQRPGPGARGPKSHRGILTPGCSNLYHLWGPLTHLPGTSSLWSVKTTQK